MAPASTKPALLVVDVQVGAFDGQRMAPLTDGERVLGNLARLLARARQAGIAVIFVQDDGRVGGAFEPGTAHWALHPRLGRRADERVVRKAGPSAFEGTPLAVELRAAGIGHLVVGGLHSDGCVRATLLHGQALGFAMTLVTDAHGVPQRPDAAASARAVELALAEQGICLTSTERWLPAPPEELTMDPRERFSSTVEDYRRFRPDYPAALFDWLLPFAGLAAGDTVLDVGCGTGISSRHLAEYGLRVFGVDPNGPMLDAARAEGGEVTYVQSDAETLAVPVDRCDAIVGGQSFHWIDVPRANRRFRELLRPDGWVVAFWNLRDDTDPLMGAYARLLEEWSPEYGAVAAEPRARAVAETVEATRAEFTHGQALDRAGFFGRVWSSSYVRNVVTDRAGFDAELQALFEAHAVDGHIDFVYRTLALAWQP